MVQNAWKLMVPGAVCVLGTFDNKKAFLGHYPRHISKPTEYFSLKRKRKKRECPVVEHLPSMHKVQSLPQPDVTDLQ